MARPTRLIRVLVAITCTVGALGAGIGRATAASTSTTAAPILPRGFIVVDAGTGEILVSHNDHVAYRPASTIKIMTALTAMERLAPDARITVSALAASAPASKINMKQGQVWPFAEALDSLMVVSANDAAYAIAEATSGSLAAFANAEATTGRQLGLKDSTFNDPAGLDDGNAYQGGPLMSAYDIAISARNALSVPVLARLAASPVVSFVGPDGIKHTLVNHNKLVSDHLYPGATGMKTGFTDKAGHTLIATATRNGRTLIAVILGTDDAYGWATRLLDTGFGTARGHGTGASLPATMVTTYATRAAEFTAFERLSIGPGTSSLATAAPLPDRAPTTTVAVASLPAAKTATKLTASSVTGKKHGGGLSTTTLLLLVLIFVLATLYVLRVRAVRRARARRLARRRATHSMMRRGSLPVVDGRYRTGTRVGKPVESHVQIRRDDEPGSAEASG
jgi:serine-type D-Ala-D-Ala carboxypeptidase (penicillin-binding protein 5/6)